jgi:hypothetical protein
VPAFEAVGERSIREPERERLGVRAPLQAGRRYRRGRRDRNPLPHGRPLASFCHEIQDSSPNRAFLVHFFATFPLDLYVRITAHTRYEIKQRRITLRRRSLAAE